MALLQSLAEAIRKQKEKLQQSTFGKIATQAQKTLQAPIRQPIKLSQSIQPKLTQAIASYNKVKSSASDYFRPVTGTLATAGREKVFRPAFTAMSNTKLSPTVQKVADVPLSLMSGAEKGAAGFTGANKPVRKILFGKDSTPYVPQTTLGKVADVAGGIAGFAVGPGKILAPLESTVAARTGLNLLPKTAPKAAQLLRKALIKTIPATMAESASSAVLAPIESLSTGKSLKQSFKENLAGGVAGRGVFSAVAPMAGLLLKKSASEGLTDILKREDLDIIDNFIDTVNSGKGKKEMGQLGTDIQNIVTQPKIKKVLERIMKTDPGVASNRKLATGLFKFMSAVDKPDMGLSVKAVGDVAQAEKLKQANLPAQPVVDNTPISKSNASPDVSDYVKQKVSDMKTAEGKTGIFSGLRTIAKDIKSKIVDSTAAIEDILTKAEKKSNLKILPTQDIRYQIDKAIRSDTLATQYIKDSGMVDVIKDVPSLDEFGQYLIAKHSAKVAGKGIETGRDLVKDQKLVKEFGSIYEPYVAKVKSFTNGLLDYNVKNGLISKELADTLKKEYPDYVPLKRVFDQAEISNVGVGGGVASVGTQKVVQRLKGSEREIRNPLESLMESAAISFRQGERNVAAQQLISYKDLPGNPFDLRQLGKDEAIGTKHTISAFINGQKVTYETTKEVADAAKGLNREQMNLLSKILSIPTRILQIGAVGLNIPFVASNLVKDQLTASVLSSRPLATSLANPVNFVKAIYQTLGHGKTYDDWVRSGASFTSFDIARDQLGPQLARIRADKSLGSKIVYKVTNPGELLRTVENLIGKAEEVTRIQNFEGMKQSLIKEGRTVADADLLGAYASRMNTANFGRRGDWGAVLNSAIPFFNAGIQGARSLVRAVVKNPAGTAVNFAATIGIPVVTMTAWNLSDPKRKEAYADIPDYEKENNMIILPPNPTQDENGRWNAIKIPMTPGISNLANIVRKQIEGTQSVKNVASNLLSATTSLDLLNPRGLVSQMTPQAIKPGIESLTNTNLYTGQKIVPEYMKNMPASQQFKPNTSLTAKKIGQTFNVSPLKTENAVRTAGAGVASQLLGASDKILGKVTGETPPPTRSVTGDIKRRFTSAAGGERTSQYYDFKGKFTGEISAVKSMLKNDQLDISTVDPTSAAEAIYQEIAKLPQKDRAKAYDYLAPKLNDQVKKEIAAIKKYDTQGITATDRYLLSYPKEVRARAVVERIMDLDKKNRSKKYDDLVRAGIVTPDMALQIKKLVTEYK